MTRRLVVEAANAVSGTTLVLTIGATEPVVGRHLVLCTGWSGSTSATVTSVVDSKSNTWQMDETRGSPSGATGAASSIWSCKITTGLVAGDTVTITFAGAANTYHLGRLLEYDNLATASWKDTSGDGITTPAGTAVASAAATTAATDEVVVAVAVWGGATAASSTVASTSPWADVGSPLTATGATQKALATAQLDTTAVGADAHYAGTLSASFEASVCAVAYKTTTSAGAGTLTSAWTGAVTESGATVAVQCASAATSRLKVATDSGLTANVAFSSSAVPDGNGLAKLTIAGLGADTQYYYQVEVDSVLASALPGKFRTAATPGTPTSFSMLFGSCQLSGSNHAVFGTMRTHSGLYGTARQFVHLGDAHYDNITANTPSLFRAATATVLSHSLVQQLLREVPTPYVWSDHDSAGGNDHDGTATGMPAAQSVYRETVPHYTLPDAAAIYQAWTVGRIRFALTDLRSEKDPRTDTDNSSKFMMSQAQEDWFLGQFDDPDVALVVWGCEMPWVGPAEANADYWAGYDTQRQRIASAIVASGTPCVIVSGDTHCLAADDGSNSPGGIPVFQAAPFSQNTSVKPSEADYSQGTYPHEVDVGPDANQYGWLDVTDTGSSVTVAYTGYDSAEVARMVLSVEFADAASEGYWGVLA